MIVTARQYRTLIVDPPWPMQVIRRKVRPRQVAMPYRTMTLDEIAALPIGAIAAPDAHLFLWTTQRFLPHGFTMLRRWGFRYVFAMVWHKAGGFQPVGLPQYNCEFVLYARRGTAKFRTTRGFSTCFPGDRREHSRKPDGFYETVARVTDGPRLDVFSREPREGFEQWGDQPNHFETKEAA